MSENYRYYAAKMAELHTHRASPELDRQLNELFTLIRKCEELWALEERIDRGSNEKP